MGQITRSELRKQIMTILYQINVYEQNKIEYKVEDVIKEVCEIDNEFVKDVVYGVITYKNDFFLALAPSKLPNVYCHYSY